MKAKKIASVVLAGALCVSALTGCGATKNTTIATLGDQKVTYGVANFMVRLSQANNEDMYRAYLGENPWSMDPYSSGKTMGEQTKESIMEGLHEMYTVYNHMGDVNVSLSSEEEAAIKEAATKFMEENDKKALKAMGATQEIVEETLKLYTVRQKVYDAVIADVDTNVTDDEANMRAYSMIRVNISGQTDPSTYQYTAYTDEEKAQISSEFQKFVGEIGDPTNLEAVAEANENYSVSKATYDKDDELDDALRSGLDSLKEGEMSDVIVTETALYVVRIDKDTDEEATETNRKSILQNRKDTLYNDKLTAWQDGIEWTVDKDVLAKITFTDAFTQQDESTESADNTEAGTEE